MEKPGKLRGPPLRDVRVQWRLPRHRRGGDPSCPLAAPAILAAQYLFVDNECKKKGGVVKEFVENGM